MYFYIKESSTDALPGRTIYSTIGIDPQSGDIVCENLSEGKIEFIRSDTPVVFLDDIFDDDPEDVIY